MQLVLADWTGCSNGLDLDKTCTAVNLIGENLGVMFGDGLQVHWYGSPLFCDQ